MVKQPFFSIVMPAYNASSVIGIALASVRRQDFDQEFIEILVIDGGSTDSTRKIALKYGAVVLDNPYKLPGPAQVIGFTHSKGKFIIKMDTDEAFIHPDQLSKRAALFEKYPQVKCLVANRLLPVKGYGIASAYANQYGDPFTLFIYKAKKDTLTTFKRNIVNKSENGKLLAFSKIEIKPIGDAGTTTFSLDFARLRFGKKLSSVEFAARITEETIRLTGLCGCIDGDEVEHRTNGTFKVFLAKIRYRIITNIFRPEESGFSALEDSSPPLAKRKKLFYLYSLSIIWPLADSIRLTVIHRDIKMFLHFYYLYYTCCYIAYCLILKKLKREKKIAVYGVD